MENELLDALKIEYGKKHWDTEVELIETLGLTGSEEAKIFIKNNYIDKGYFLNNSTKAYIRLNRLSACDVSDVIIFLENDNNYNMLNGVLSSLGYDKIIPSIEDQEKIINLCWDAGKDRPKGCTDPRYGLAAACAGWKSDKVIPFLKHCLESNDVPLIYVSENSLKGKYVKLR
uniref:hypothetical protein n=1 Tax=Flavobacterium sp. TaxID=239 RepID=UPI00404B466A